MTRCLPNQKGYKYVPYVFKTLEKRPHGNFIKLFGNKVLSHSLRTGPEFYERYLSTFEKRNKAIGQENGQMTRRKKCWSFSLCEQSLMITNVMGCLSGHVRALSTLLVSSLMVINKAHM